MDVSKKSLVLICLLLLICLVLSFSLYSIKFSNSVICNDNDVIKKIDGAHYLEAFDIMDFSDNHINTIDIVSKEYINNMISVSDSDFRLSDELNNKITNLIQSYGAASSFYIVSLDDGMSVGYNVDKKYETASSIKAPYALYVYREIAKGNIDPNRVITYEPTYYNKGTGVVKNSDFGTGFTVRKLVYYSLNDSDNVAHIMLHRNFGVKGYNAMLQNLGTQQLYLTASNPWGFTSARSAALVWQDIYNFAIEDSYGIELMNILSNGKYNYFKEVMPTIPSASKTGFANSDVVETGIVFDKHPYIAIAEANKGGSRGAYTQILQLVNAMNEIMQEYNTYLE